MSIIKKFLDYVRYLLLIRKVKITEPKYCLPIDYQTALRHLRSTGKTEVGYKRYPFKEYMISLKVLVSKVQVDLENMKYKYLYSSWISDEEFKDRAILKFGEEDFDFMGTLQKETIFRKENSEFLEKYHISTEEERRLISTYDGLEELLFKLEDVKYAQEYILDQIFLKYPEKLYYLFDSIYTNKFSIYIKEYYSKLVILLFEYTDYSTLVQYFDTIERSYTSDTKSGIIRNKLLEIIQRKNTLEVKKEQLRREQKLNQTSVTGLG